MVKVKMLGRHTAITGYKLEQGLEYNFPLDYATELVKHGLATLVAVPMVNEESMEKTPSDSKTEYQKNRSNHGKRIRRKN